MKAKFISVYEGRGGRSLPSVVVVNLKAFSEKEICKFLTTQLELKIKSFKDLRLYTNEPAPQINDGVLFWAGEEFTYLIVGM